jgi:hypothetical protein
MLEVDNRVILPEITHTRFILTAADMVSQKLLIKSHSPTVELSFSKNNANRQFRPLKLCL